MSIHPTILCALDFSPSSERALERAAYLGARLGAPIELVHVYHVPVLNAPAGQVAPIPDVVAKLLARAQDELDRRSAPLLARGLRVTTKLLDGDIAGSIVRYAQESGAWVIVLGTHGRSGWQRLVVGSTAERVVRLSQTPVLTVSNAP